MKFHQSSKKPLNFFLVRNSKNPKKMLTMQPSDQTAAPTKADKPDVVPSAPSKKRYTIQHTAPSPKKTAEVPPPHIMQSFLEEQKKKLEELRGSVFITGGPYQGPELVNIKDLFLHFMHGHDNLFYFVDHSYNPCLVKGPISEEEYTNTKNLQSLDQTLPTRYLSFFVPVNLPLGTYATYLLQPLYGMDLFEIQNSDSPLRDQELDYVICLVLKKIAALHAKGYTHGDISPENFVYSRSALDHTRIPGGPLHLIDFQEVQLASEHRAFVPYGKKNYMDPFLSKCLEFNHTPKDCYTPYCPDIYAAGVVVWGLVFNSLPVLSSLAEQGTRNYIANCRLPPIPDGLMELLVSLLDMRKDKNIQSSLDQFEESLKKSLKTPFSD